VVLKSPPKSRSPSKGLLGSLFIPKHNDVIIPITNESPVAVKGLDSAGDLDSGRGLESVGGKLKGIYTYMYIHLYIYIYTYI
jgi:hypothetical protein